MHEIKIKLMRGKEVVCVLENCRFEDSQYQVVVEELPPILICYAQEKYFALEDKCPHQGRGMFGGCIRDGSIICPFHGLKIDLLTGHPETTNGLSNKKVQVYSVVKESETLLVFL